MTDADLSHANLTGADLTMIDLSRLKLVNAVLSEVKGMEEDFIGTILLTTEHQKILNQWYGNPAQVKKISFMY